MRGVHSNSLENIRTHICDEDYNDDDTIHNSNTTYPHRIKLGVRDIRRKPLDPGKTDQFFSQTLPFDRQSRGRQQMSHLAKSKSHDLVNKSHDLESLSHMMSRSHDLVTKTHDMGSTSRDLLNESHDPMRSHNLVRLSRDPTSKCVPFSIENGPQPHHGADSMGSDASGTRDDVLDSVSVSAAPGQLESVASYRNVFTKPIVPRLPLETLDITMTTESEAPPSYCSTVPSSMLSSSTTSGSYSISLEDIKPNITDIVFARVTDVYV